MTTMSRSARNRLAAKMRRDNRPAPRGRVGVHTQPRPGIGACPHDSGRIRCVGYLGRNPDKVRYSGSGDQGYRSERTGSMDFYTDHRWDATASRPVSY